MATCRICGDDAGYLHSICEPCKASRPPPTPEPPPSQRKTNPLKLDPDDRAHQINIWAKVAGVLVGVPVLVLLALFFYGLNIPEYESNARQVRKVCVDYLVTPDRRHVCDEIYDQAIHEGRARAEQD